MVEAERIGLAVPWSHMSDRPTLPALWAFDLYCPFLYPKAFLTIETLYQVIARRLGLVPNTPHREPEAHADNDKTYDGSPAHTPPIPSSPNVARRRDPPTTKLTPNIKTQPTTPIHLMKGVTSLSSNSSGNSSSVKGTSRDPPQKRQTVVDVTSLFGLMVSDFDKGDLEQAEEDLDPRHFYAACIFDQAHERKDDVSTLVEQAQELGYPARCWWLSQAMELRGASDRLIVCAHHPSLASDAGMDLYEALKEQQITWDDPEAAAVEEYRLLGKPIEGLEVICRSEPKATWNTSAEPDGTISSITS